MKISYQINPQDYYAFTQFHAGATSKVIYFFLGFWILTMVMGSRELNQTWDQIITSPLLFLIIFSLIILVLGKALAMRRINNPANRFAFEQVDMTLSSLGISVRSSVNNSEIIWDMVHRVIDHPKYFFVYISTQCAYIIPKRIFMSARHEQELRTLLLKYAPHAKFVEKKRFILLRWIDRIQKK